MRELTETLKAAQKAMSLEPRPRITLSKTGESDIVLEYDRIRQIPSYEQSEDSQVLQVVLNNSDGYFTSKALQGWDAVFELGLVTSIGNEYSACAPLKVMSQSLSSDPSGLLCYLTMAGIPNQMADDKASKKYLHHKSDLKTVKDMITEVMSGQPVATELIEEQTKIDSYINLDKTQDNPIQAVGQRMSVPNRLITKVAFRLEKTGAPAGTNVTFVIRDVETEAILASKVFPIASISTSPTWCETTLTLTGTVTFTGGSTAVTGSGTLFTTELKVGDIIKKSTGTSWYTVASITDNISLTLTANADAGDNGADTANATYFGCQVDKEITWAGSTPSGGVWIYCEHVDGTATDYVSVSYNSYAVKANEWGLYVLATGGPDDLNHIDEDCTYRYKYIADGIDCWARGTTPTETYCTAYEVVYDPHGTHTGGTHATIMTDSAAAFVVDALIGLTIYNVTDGSYGTITDNNATTVTVTSLSGGSDNQWEVNDSYIIADSLLDTYLPKDAFIIQKNDNRLSVINRLLAFTSCVKIFKADGKMHVKVPTTSGAVYDYEYSLATDDHKFFSKSSREALVSPNRYVVSSYEDDDDQYSGSATSAASYALLPKSEFVSRKLVDGAQGTAIAEALIAQAERAASRGSTSVPINVGAEVWDFVKVTDARQSDSRTGNLGVIRRAYNPTAETWRMNFSFGKGVRKAIPGTVPSAFEEIIPEAIRDANEVVTWGGFEEELAKFEDKVWHGKEDGSMIGINDLSKALMLTAVPNLLEILDAVEKLGYDWPKLDDTIATALLGYLRRLQDDPNPTLGANLDTNGKYILSGNGKILLSTTELWFLISGVIFKLTATDALLRVPLDMNLEKITDLGAPAADADAATKKYVDDNAGVLTNTTVDTTLITQGTDYQNTTGKLLFVVVASILNLGESASLRIGASSPPATEVNYTEGSSNDGGVFSIAGIVPVNYYWKVVGAGQLVKSTTWTLG